VFEEEGTGRKAEKESCLDNSKGYLLGFRCNYF